MGYGAQLLSLEETAVGDSKIKVIDIALIDRLMAIFECKKPYLGSQSRENSQRGYMKSDQHASPKFSLSLGGGGPPSF